MSLKSFIQGKPFVDGGLQASSTVPPPPGIPSRSQCTEQWERHRHSHGQEAGASLAGQRPCLPGKGAGRSCLRGLGPLWEVSCQWGVVLLRAGCRRLGLVTCTRVLGRPPLCASWYTNSLLALKFETVSSGSMRKPHADVPHLSKFHATAHFSGGAAVSEHFNGIAQAAWDRVWFLWNTTSLSLSLSIPLSLITFSHSHISHTHSHGRE